MPEKTEHTRLFATQVLESIASDAAWEWAANEQNRDALQAMKGGAKARLTNFGRQYLLEETSVMGKRFNSVGKQAVELGTFITPNALFDELATKSSKMLKHTREHGLRHGMSQ